MSVAANALFDVQVSRTTGRVLVIIGGRTYPLSPHDAAQLARVVLQKVPEARAANVARLRAGEVA